MLLYGIRTDGKAKYVAQRTTMPNNSYFHRKLEDMNGDEHFVLDDKDIEVLMGMENGIIPVSVMLANGKFVPATMYFWFVKSDIDELEWGSGEKLIPQEYEEFRSLVVLPYDKQGNEEALERYQKRAYSL